MNVISTHTSTTAVSSCSVSTSSSESLRSDGERPNQPRRLLFPKCNYGHMISMKNVFRLSLSRSGIHTSILEGWSGGFCKHKSSSFYNQTVEVIYKEASGHDADVGTYYLNFTG